MKKILAIVLAMVLVLSLTAFAAAETIEPPKKPIRVSLGTSSAGGNFYLVGGGVAGLINSKLPEFFNVTAEETGGSSANLQMMEAGEMEIAIAMTSAIAEGLSGTAKWSVNGQPMEKVRGLVPLYPSYLTMYTLASSGITGMAQYPGKIVGTGSSGAAMDSYLRKAFTDLSYEPKDIFNDGYSQTATAIADGQIDVACLFSFPPFAAISELEATKDLHFISLTEAEQEYFTSNYPFYSKATMPAGSYKGNADYDVNTISEWNMLVCTVDLEEDYVYTLAKMIFENNPELLNIHHSLSYCAAENCQFFNLPLHAGVVRYLEEIGVEVPAELIPAEYAK